MADKAKHSFQGRGEVRIRREGGRVVLEAGKRVWSRRFLALAGSASDFPYPSETAPAEPVPPLR